MLLKVNCMYFCLIFVFFYLYIKKEQIFVGLREYKTGSKGPLLSWPISIKNESDICKKWVWYLLLKRGCKNGSKEMLCHKPESAKKQKHVPHSNLCQRPPPNNDRLSIMTNIIRSYFKFFIRKSYLWIAATRRKGQCSWGRSLQIRLTVNKISSSWERV